MLAPPRPWKRKRGSSSCCSAFRCMRTTPLTSREQSASSSALLSSRVHGRGRGTSRAKFKSRASMSHQPAAMIASTLFSKASRVHEPAFAVSRPSGSAVVSSFYDFSRTPTRRTADITEPFIELVLDGHTAPGHLTESNACVVFFRHS